MSGSAVASPHGAIVEVPEIPDTESGLAQVVGPVSEVLMDAQESVGNVLRAAKEPDGLSELQAGSLMLRAQLYTEYAEQILSDARELERVAFDQSFYGTPR